MRIEHVLCIDGLQKLCLMRVKNLCVGSLGAKRETVC